MATETPSTTMPTREQLVALCDAGVVSQSEWRNRDSAGAQRQLGEARALLLAGCDFTFDESTHGCWWIEITYRGFDYFESSRLSTDTAYIPTRESLDRAAGADWY